MFSQSVANGFNLIAKNPISGVSNIATAGGINVVTGAIPTLGVGTANKVLDLVGLGNVNIPGFDGVDQVGGLARMPVVGAMQTLWANFSTQRDLELFKRNIYPGNGIGVAQFLGGDLDEGWSTLASVDANELDREKFGYTTRLSNSSWSGLLERSSDYSDVDANDVLDKATSANRLVDSSRILGFTEFAVGGAVSGVSWALLGKNLLKPLAGRGVANIYKTLGLLSDLDDDLYDEVSFRAQTYMRSVWDLFQTCARLLPNYIVAVRPFEDRSTVFYGKPHWLYTSGVYPISTGFPNDEVAEIEGINVPNYILPDDSLQSILNLVNKETSSIKDALALSQNQESSVSDSIASMTRDMLSFNGIFKAGGALRGKIINFSDTNRTVYYGKDDKIISRLPVTKGKVQVGFHLPFGLNGTYAPIQKEDHLQIDQLPLRFRYPFFTNRVSGTLPSLDFDKIINSTHKDDLIRSVNNVVNLAILDQDLVSKGKGNEETDLVSESENKYIDYVLNFNFNFAKKIPLLGIEEQTYASAAFDPSGIYDPQSGFKQKTASLAVQMPLPVLDLADVTVGNNTVQLTDEFQRYFNELDPIYGLQQQFKQFSIDFSEWGMPKTAEEEQFYIAMRWPYDPIRSKNVGDSGKNLKQDPVAREALSKFMKLYNIKESDLAGTADDYKKRRVLVYNKATRTAVVCAPAYFLWDSIQNEEDEDSRIDAIVSPDAAYFLGLLMNKRGQIVSPFDDIDSRNLSDIAADAVGEINPFKVLQGGIFAIGEIAGAIPIALNSNGDFDWENLGMVGANWQECMFTFVPDDTPLGVVTSTYNPANIFSTQFPYVTEGDFFVDKIADLVNNGEDEFLIGFGAVKIDESRSDPGIVDKIADFVFNDVLDLEKTFPARKTTVEGGSWSRNVGHPALRASSKYGVVLKEDYIFDEVIQLKTFSDWQKEWSKGGNYTQYYDKIIDNNLEELSQEKLIEKLKEDKDENKYDDFITVYSDVDAVSVTARGFYDENFDSEIKVIAGNGRTLSEANTIWNQFRYGYHNYDSVKNIFQQVYQLDPDDDRETSDELFNLLTGRNRNLLPEFSADNSNSEFTSLLGADFIAGSGTQNAAVRKEAIDIAVNEYIDGGYDGVDEENKVVINPRRGLIDATNAIMLSKVRSIRTIVQNHFQTYEYSNANEESADSKQKAEELLKSIKSPKQLFLLIVGIFRQKMWSDPYARAWLVLRPTRKRFNPQFKIPGSFDYDEWSFRSVDRIFHAFIDYDAEYSSNNQNFLKLLERNAKEGSSASNWVTGIYEDVSNFWDRNVGPIFNAFDAALGNLLNMFRLSMAQMGYGLNQLENFTRQANILNKAYNDSIYYSLGRPGSLLRAVDNPFTREYGEPVVEVRQPFQRLHYLSSFTHILSNNIKESGQVATQITAVSDGKYPITVSFDKAAPPEKQIEQTVETGIFFDNMKGEGVFQFLHPIFNPIETFRGMAKYTSGDSDEITARRVGLAHLKESLKDIYGGEIIVIGNADIRPHDLVYLADVYERMYGIFEVEQVVHHFTPETGFVTSITPNAFVTVNDPARWFMASWTAAHFSMQNLRNDTRLMLSTNSTSAIINGDISVDSLSDMLKDQMLGGIQYTHGHTALIKDIYANSLADTMPDNAGKIQTLVKAATGRIPGSVGGAVFAGIVMPTITAGATIAATAAGTVVGGPVAGAAAGAVTLAGFTLASDIGWSAWKWLRDNVLDQHGCYIQYLTKNGQPMDASLSSFQGMIVGRYHSKKLLPSLLGTRTKVRTPEGNAFIRTDDLMKAIGYKEKEITTIARQIDLENAIVHSEILKYSGIGPERTGLNQYFKAIVRAEHFTDGDTIDVYDILTDKKYTIRFDGINTSELTKNNVTSTTAIINPNSLASQALNYTRDALEGVLFVLRINPNNSNVILTSEDYEAGSVYNNPENYRTSFKPTKSSWEGDDRYMATIFYKTDQNVYDSSIARLRSIFISVGENVIDRTSYFKEKVKELISPESVIYSRFDKIYDQVFAVQSKYKNDNSKFNEYIYFEPIGQSDPLNGMSIFDKRTFDTLMGMLILHRVYEKASEWPLADWNEYYDDASPVTLNWELVAAGLAKVYTGGLNSLRGPALEDIYDVTPIAREVNRGNE